jgi:2-oxoglutarate dehydrogenase complex dehydrogenase (E1) component-like enzyme
MPDEVVRIILNKLNQIDSKQDAQADQLSAINSKLATIEEKQKFQEKVNDEVENLKELKEQGLGVKSVLAWLLAMALSLIALFKSTLG